MIIEMKNKVCYQCYSSASRIYLWSYTINTNQICLNIYKTTTRQQWAQVWIYFFVQNHRSYSKPVEKNVQFFNCLKNLNNIYIGKYYYKHEVYSIVHIIFGFTKNTSVIVISNDGDCKTNCYFIHSKLSYSITLHFKSIVWNIIKMNDIFYISIITIQSYIDIYL